MKEFKEEIKLCSCCGKELSKTNKSGLCKDCFNESRKKAKEVNKDDRFYNAKPVISCERTWGTKTIKIHKCPNCDIRIWNPDKDNFCYNCGQKLLEISKEEK